MRRIFICFILFFCQTIYGNDTLGFVSPVDHQIRLTGNFMEIRPNHFHSGIDIKSSNGVPGDVIKAAQVGHVSRIRITSGSYGNALYLDHPNGYTSVYAHLNSFAPEIESYLKKVQYAVESFEVDIYLPDSLLQVSKSQKIGTMGNTGRSFGPHLHFEIRETKTEMPVNPEEMGIGPSDNKAPTLQSLHIYTLGKENQLLSTDIKYFNPKSSTPKLYADVIETNSDKIGLGLQMYDTMNGSSNKNGVYSYRVYVDGKLEYKWAADEYSFNENRKINGFIDFQKQKALGQKVYLLYKQNCNALNGIESVFDGTISLKDKSSKEIRIIAEDLYQNHAEFKFTLKKKGTHSESNTESINCAQSITKKSGIFKIDFDPETFYRPTDIAVKSGKENVLGQSCHSIEIGDKNTAVNKYFKISCPIPKDYGNNWTFITTDSRGRFVTFGADTLGGKMFTWVDQLGKFFIYSDTKAPQLQIINLEASMKRPWKIKITDNLIPDGRSDDLNYRATVNGKWILMRYDLKNDILIFDNFEELPRKPIEFQLIVTDNSLNANVLKKTIN